MARFIRTFICTFILGALVTWAGRHVGLADATTFAILLIVTVGFALSTWPRPRDG
jgi:hypothetical protein